MTIKSVTTATMVGVTNVAEGSISAGDLVLLDKTCHQRSKEKPIQSLEDHTLEKPQDAVKVAMHMRPDETLSPMS